MLTCIFRHRCSRSCLYGNNWHNSIMNSHVYLLFEFQQSSDCFELPLVRIFTCAYQGDFKITQYLLLSWTIMSHTVAQKIQKFAVIFISLSVKETYACCRRKWHHSTELDLNSEHSPTQSNTVRAILCTSRLRVNRLQALERNLPLRTRSKKRSAPIGAQSGWTCMCSTKVLTYRFQNSETQHASWHS